jgi:hypothetical protein
MTIYKMAIRTIDGVTYDISDPEQKKAFKRHYQRNYHRKWYANNAEKARESSRKYVAKRNEDPSYPERRRKAQRKYIAGLPPEKKKVIRERARVKAKIRYENDEEYAKTRNQKALDYYHNGGGKERAKERYLRSVEEKKSAV